MLSKARDILGELLIGDSGRKVAFILLLGLLTFRFFDPVILQVLRVNTFDLFQNLKPRQVTERPVVIVDIDEESLLEFGQWPWPRNILAKIVHRLDNMGAKVIGFDIFFIEPDRVSPAQLAKSLSNLDPEILRNLYKLPDNDELFARAIAKSTVVMGQSVDPVEKGLGSDRLAEVTTIPFIGSDPRKHLINNKSIFTNISILNKAAAGHGAVALVPEYDGIVRRVPLVVQVDGQLIPSLSTEMLRIYFGGGSAFLKTSADIGIENIVIKGRPIPTLSDGRYWVYYSKHDPEKYVSVRDLLNGKVDANHIKDKLVLIGTSASGLLDIRATPLDGSIPGVEVHAQVIENILQDNQLTRPQFAALGELAATAIVGFLLIWLIPTLGAKWTLFLGVLLVAGMVEGAWLAFTVNRLLFDPIYPSLVVIALYIYLSYRTFAREEKQRQEVRNAFAHYLSPELVGRLAADPSALNLGGEMRDMSILFSDIRSFTSLSEGYDAEELTQLINSYLTPMSDIILRRQGTIDKYMGDCIMAFWNAPLDVPDHPMQACRTAIEMQEALKQFNARMLIDASEKEINYQEFRIGIGINTGIACVGNIGSEQRFSYSVLGDNVNIASRLEELTKTYRTMTIAGQNTQEQTHDLAWLEVDEIRIRGRSQAQKIFTLVGDETFAGSDVFVDLLKIHNEMLKHYRSQNFAAALESASKCQVHPAAANFSRLYDVYISRTSEYLKVPPSTDWDGVYQAPSEKKLSAA